MKVKAVVEQEGGSYEFTAELDERQHAFLIEYAIKDLMLKGLLPFASADTPQEQVSIISQSYNPETPN